MALRFQGNIVVPVDGEYTFAVVSDDGARLMIDDKPVLDNDGTHAATEGKGSVVLTRGEHARTVVYFNETGSVPSRHTGKGRGSRGRRSRRRL